MSNGNLRSDVGDMATGRGGATKGVDFPTHGMACGGTIASTNLFFRMAEIQPMELSRCCRKCH